MGMGRSAVSCCSSALCAGSRSIFDTRGSFDADSKPSCAGVSEEFEFREFLGGLPGGADEFLNGLATSRGRVKREAFARRLRQLSFAGDAGVVFDAFDAGGQGVVALDDLRMQLVTSKDPPYRTKGAQGASKSGRRSSMDGKSGSKTRRKSEVASGIDSTAVGGDGNGGGAKPKAGNAGASGEADGGAGAGGAAGGKRPPKSPPGPSPRRGNRLTSPGRTAKASPGRDALSEAGAARDAQKEAPASEAGFSEAPASDAPVRERTLEAHDHGPPDAVLAAPKAEEAEAPRESNVASPLKEPAPPSLSEGAASTAAESTTTTFVQLRPLPYDWGGADDQDDRPRTFWFRGEVIEVPLLPLGELGAAGGAGNKARSNNGWQKVKSKVMGGGLKPTVTAELISLAE